MFKKNLITIVKFQNEVTLFLTPKPHPRVEPWCIVLRNESLCYDAIMYSQLNNVPNMERFLPVVGEI